ADWAVATGTTTAAVPAAVRATRRSDWTGSFIGEGPRLRGLGWGGAGRGPGPGSTGGAGGRARGLGALHGDLADAGPLALRAGRRRRAQAAEPRLERGECLGLCQPVAGGEGLARGQPGHGGARPRPRGGFRQAAEEAVARRRGQDRRHRGGRGGERRLALGLRRGGGRGFLAARGGALRLAARGAARSRAAR